MSNSIKKPRNKPVKSTKTSNKTRAGISFKPELLEALDNYAKEQCNGDRSLAVNQLLEKPLAKYEVAPLCPEHNQRMWRGKKAFYCLKQGCRMTQPFRLKK